MIHEDEDPKTHPCRAPWREIYADPDKAVDAIIWASRRMASPGRCNRRRRRCARPPRQSGRGAQDLGAGSVRPGAKAGALTGVGDDVTWEPYTHTVRGWMRELDHGSVSVEEAGLDGSGRKPWQWSADTGLSDAQGSCKSVDQAQAHALHAYNLLVRLKVEAASVENP